MAPRPAGPHPGRGLGVTQGWLSLAGDYSAAVVRKADELSTLRPESLTILVDIVNKCNLRCIMCHFTFDEVFYQRSQLLSPDTFASIARAIRPYTHKLTLSAAYEPTTSPHFAEILRIAGTHRFPELSFLTNGNLLNAALIEAVLDAGVTEVCVSVHAARAATYAHILRGGSIEKAIGNVEKLIARRRERGSTLPRVQFNIALMRSNLSELVEIVELAARLGVDAVAFRHLIVFEGLSMEQESLSHQDRTQVNRHIRRALLRARELGVTITNAADFFDTDEFPAHAQRVDSEPFAAEPPREPSLGKKMADMLTRLGLRRPQPQQPQPQPNPVIGFFDTPADDVYFYAPEVELRGWALAPSGITEVAVSREPLPHDPPSAIGRYGFVEIGLARFHNGTRPDVVRAYPDHTHSYRAGWSFMLQRQQLPMAAADGTLRIQAVARDAAGNALMIGERRVHLNSSLAEGACHLRCSKPFDSLYIDARANVFPYSDCHTDQPFGQMREGHTFEDVWHDPRLAALRLDMVAGNAPGMCVRCPLFINRAVDDAATFAPHVDFSTETVR
ncbi:MAG: radical SAM protein [Rhodanobacteraceae bacterium]|nr:radical SAM protein [Rhodanobacteraceae bacterium]